jgi:hypothetical protein
MPVRTNPSVRAHVCIMRCGSITLKRAVGSETVPHITHLYDFSKHAEKGRGKSLPQDQKADG